MEPFIGEIRPFAFEMNPRGWLPCDGRILNVQGNTALYALLGNQYGGTGPTTFALPDLRGRVPLGFGFTLPLAKQDGSETVTLTADEVPSHTHQVLGSSATASTNAPSTHALATLTTTDTAYAAPDAAAATLNIDTVTPNGGSMPHPNMQPSLAVNWCIAVTGQWPDRP